MAPIPGETKVWQYITLMKRIYLIDCPGIVYDTGDDETAIVLKVKPHPPTHPPTHPPMLPSFPGIKKKEPSTHPPTHPKQGVVRAERLPDPTEFITPILEIVKEEYISRTYGIKEWADALDFMTKIAKKTGKLVRPHPPPTHPPIYLSMIHLSAHHTFLIIHPYIHTCNHPSIHPPTHLPTF